MKRWKVAGINFDHFHMGDNLQMAWEHPQVDLVAVCDEQPQRMLEAKRQFGLTDEQVFTDWKACLDASQPDIVLLCPTAAEHGLWTQRVAPSGAHVIVEKPFAASLEEADLMVEAMKAGGGQLCINWPMTWYPTNQTARQLIEQRVIGDVIQVHYYDGNRGPLWHTAGKAERTAEQVAEEKPHSWFYSKSHGGGSMLDYLGYGTTLATWFNGGQVPEEVFAMVDSPAGLEVDEHAIVVAKYASGLSKFETRWGTFTDPWTHQPQPRCGFLIVGTDGTVSGYDFQPFVTVQTTDRPECHEVPVMDVAPPFQNPVQYMIHCLESEIAIQGPSNPAISRIGQQIVDAAIQSVEQKRSIPLQRELAD